MKIGIAALAAISLGSAAFASTADSPFGNDTAVLSLSGLDLKTADGQQRLAIRVDQAARAVCGENLATIHAELSRLIAEELLGDAVEVTDGSGS